MAEPVVRHGDKPKLVSFKNKDGYIKPLLQQLEALKNDSFQSVAIIGKTLKECKKIEEDLTKTSNLSFKLLTGEEEFNPEEIVIVPSYIAKGLEFDSVFIVTIDDAFTVDDLDVKLLYVALTRPLL